MEQRAGGGWALTGFFLGKEDGFFFIGFISGVLVLESQGLDVCTLLVSGQAVDEIVLTAFMMVELIPGSMVMDIFCKIKFSLPS